MYTRTLAQLQTAVQTLGSYENSADITPAVLLQVINDALEETYNICVACRDDFYVRISTPFTVVSGQDTYSPPADFYNLRKVEISTGPGTWKRLLPVPVDGANLFTAYGLPTFGTLGTDYRYRISTAGLTLVPAPVNSSDIIRMYYLPLAPQLAVAGDTVTFDRPVEQKLVAHIALRDCYMRQDLSTAQLDAKIEQMSMQLRTAADSHDDGQPFYLSRTGPGNDDWNY